MHGFVSQASQPASTAVWTGLQLARWCESASASPFFKYVLKRDVPFPEV